MKIGDRVRVKSISPSWHSAIGMEGIWIDSFTTKAGMRYKLVKFDHVLADGRPALWCEEIEPVYVPVTLPKELFEI
jgi:hypothetical protein